MMNRAVPFIALAVVTLLLASCGGQETKSESSAPPPASSAGASSVSVEIAESDAGFDPKSVTVERGQLV